MFVYSCFFVDLLQPSATLSAAFQEADIDADSAAMAKAKCQLSLLMEKEPEKMATVKHYLTKVQEDNYQGLKLGSFNSALDEVRKRASFYVERVRSAKEERLEGVEDLSGVARILNCEGGNDDYVVEGAIDEDILGIAAQFETTLKLQGMVATELDLVEEWHDIVQYSLDYLKPSVQSYRATWFQLFHSSQASKWSNILLLIHLLFSLPVANAELERFFSALKQVKTSIAFTITTGRYLTGKTSRSSTGRVRSI